jgi:hypothetical protein
MFLLLQLHKKTAKLPYREAEKWYMFQFTRAVLSCEGQKGMLFLYGPIYYLHLVLFSRTKLESCVYFIKKRKDTKERQGSPPSTRERNSLYLH